MKIVNFSRAPAVNREKPVDITLVYPSPSFDSPYNLTALSILFPGAMLEAQGKRVRYLDMRWDTQDMLDDAIKESAEIGVSCFTGFQAGRAAEILERAKRLDPKIVTHVGGHHSRLCTEDVKAEQNVDVVWPERSYGEELFPWSEEAKRLWKMGDLQYLTSNGCPYACTFCALRSPWKPRDLYKIETEVAQLVELTGAKELSLLDPNMGFDRVRNENGKMEKIDRVERMNQLGRIFKSHGLKFDYNIRSDYFTPEYAEAVTEAGCFSLEFGAESGDDEFLRKVIRKGHGRDSILQANKLMAGTGVSVMNSFIRGMPRETHAQWLNTMDAIDEIMSIAPEARASVYRFTPYPGGPAYEDAINGVGIEKFTPPKTMKEWGELRLMVDPTYWVAGLNFRMDNTTKNFPGEDWKLIEPYVLEARKLWRERRPEDFKNSARVEELIEFQIRKHTAQTKVAA